MAVWTRATTLAGTIENRYNLERWQQRMVALGIADRPDLLALVHSHKDDKKALNDVCEDAINAAKGSAKANIGTSLHKFAEEIIKGDLHVNDVPPPYRADIEAMFQTLGDAATLHPDLSERTVRNTTLSVAGMFDGIADFGNDRMIWDLKTGDVHFGMLKIAAQLAIYANGDGLYNQPIQRDRWGRYDLSDHPSHWDLMPEGLRKDRGVIVHLPAGEARCELIAVDLEAGWRIAQRRLKAEDLSEVLAVVDRNTVLFDNLYERVERLSDEAKQALVNIWPQAVPYPKTVRESGERLDSIQLAAVDQALTRIEAQFEAPFDPAPLVIVPDMENAEPPVTVAERTMNERIERVLGSGEMRDAAENTAKPGSGAGFVERLHALAAATEDNLLIWHTEDEELIPRPITIPGIFHGWAKSDLLAAGKVAAEFNGIPKPVKSEQVRVDPVLAALVHVQTANNE